MTFYTYILSFILFFVKYGVPIYLLFRLFFIVQPLFVNLYFEEKFRFYLGTNKSRLLILILLCFLSFFIGIIFGNEVSSVSDTFNIIFNLFLLIFTQFVLFYMFEVKTPRSIFEIVKNCFQNPKKIFKQRKIVFEENEVLSSIIQNGVSFKDAINLTNGDIIKQVHQREFELIIEKHHSLFQDRFSIDNLYKLCNGAKIKEKSISININNKRNSKQNIVEVLTALFNIQKNWNSENKEHTNTKIIEFLNSYVLINDGEKTLHSNDFSRLFEKSK
ncbi:hypothetical protein ACHRVW_00045 [Flavobacterium collinsii]|jgi:hypothetical protein|uniref:hypothetical protein n=1 Tax=Flavobacterium collinsii TaxID=1114861 RepID=UPI0037571ED2